MMMAGVVDENRSAFFVFGRKKWLADRWSRGYAASSPTPSRRSKLFCHFFHPTNLFLLYYNTQAAVVLAAVLAFPFVIQESEREIREVREVQEVQEARE
jgi:hypothetical protein